MGRNNGAEKESLRAETWAKLPSVFTNDLTSSLISNDGTAYLVWFSHHNAYYNMRFHELEALADMAGVSLHQLYGNFPQPNSLSEECYCFVHLPDQKTIDFIMSRAVLVKFVVKVWGRGDTWESAKAMVDEEVDYEQRKLVLNEDKSFCVRIFASGSSLENDYRMERIKDLAEFVLGTRDPAVGCAENAASASAAKKAMAGDKPVMAMEIDSEKTSSGCPTSSRESAMVEVSPASSTAETSLVDNAEVSRGGLGNHESSSEMSSARSMPIIRVKAVDMKTPDTILIILEYYGFTKTHLPGKKPKDIFIGQHMHPENLSNRSNTFYEKYALNKRAVLGKKPQDAMLRDFFSGFV